MSISMYGICGIVGGVLCAIGDCLLDLKGKGNTKYGPYNLMDSNWRKMADWRFKLSILFAAVGVPLYLLGFIGMSAQLSQSNTAISQAFLLSSVIGSSGGFFIHAIVCCIPLISKELEKKGVAHSTIEELIGKIFNAIKIPFVLMYFCLVIATSIILMIAIVMGILHVPYVFLILNPLVLMLIGITLRRVNNDLFADLPGIIMPSMGIAMVGLMTVISALH